MIRSTTAALLLTFAACSTVSADLITISKVGPPIFPSRKVTPEESGNPGGGQAPVNGDVYQFVVTTDADIISVNQVRVYGPDGQPLTSLYNNAFGDAANANEGSPALIPVFPALGVDSWIQTPGTTSRLGADLPGDGQTTFGDLNNNGPQTSFMFAQLTVPDGTPLGFQGRISIASTQNPGESYVVAFNFPPIPEPTALTLAAVISVCTPALTRRCHMR